MRWLPTWLSWQTIQERVRRPLSAGERARCDRLNLEHRVDLEARQRSRRGCWANGRPIRAQIVYGEPAAQRDPRPIGALLGAVVRKNAERTGKVLAFPGRQRR